MMKIARYVLYDVLRSRVAIAYALFLLVVSFSLFQMEPNGAKAIMSLMTIILIVVPLVSLVFSTIHWYNSYEFIELMLTQPLRRNDVLLSEFFGTALSLCLAFLGGVGIPVLLFQPDASGLSLLLAGLMLTLVFVSIAFLVSVLSRDKARGIGAVLMAWFYFSIIYDGLVLLVLFSFSDYPLEKLTLVLSSLNPIDLARIFMMLQTDISALMGYTGATYKDFFGSGLGIAYTMGIMLLWILLPLLLAMKQFRKKDI